MPLYDTAASGGIESYIRLVWLFTFSITVLTLLLCYLYLRIKKTRKREQLSREFSYLVIEELEIERARISRELHDTVLPLVRGESVSDSIRLICINLMPPDFTRLSLKESLAMLCAQFSGRSGIECACSIEENFNFSAVGAETQLHLYRMIQEALNNIEKHSKAKRSSLTVRKDTRSSFENIIICVSDDGVGIQNLSAENEGLGMRSIRQRAAIIGANVDFISESENGLMVRIEYTPSNLNEEQPNG
ncbi:MAG: histidine kinase [Treponema sp.]|nr:histidine kinase [Treponema sp.]